MDVESPGHLERFRDHRAIKAVLLRMDPDPAYGEARFERSATNPDSWPPIWQLAARFRAAGTVVEASEGVAAYGQPCWLLSVRTSSSGSSPFAIAGVAGPEPPGDDVIGLLRGVCQDYWFGSTFFK